MFYQLLWSTLDTFQMTTFWNAEPCSVVDVSTSVILRDTTFQKAVSFALAVVTTSNHMTEKLFVSFQTVMISSHCYFINVQLLIGSRVAQSV
jgi:hypothetical protein